MIKIVADSSSNMYEMEGADFVSVPLKINTDVKEYVDDKNLDLKAMVEELRQYKGKSGTSCPNIGDWLDAFGDAQEVFAITITNEMSGSYSSACQAAKEYEQENPGRRAYVIDSREAGPGLRLLAEKLKELIDEGLSFDEIREQIEAYKGKKKLIFSLLSLHNLAVNGRCSHTVARLAGVLGIRLVGDAQDGNLHPLHKCRGEKKTLETMLAHMESEGFCGQGKVYISHCDNSEAVEALCRMIRDKYPQTKLFVEPTTGLCSFYAEKGGFIVGYEIA